MNIIEYTRLYKKHEIIYIYIRCGSNNNLSDKLDKEWKSVLLSTLGGGGQTLNFTSTIPEDANDVLIVMGSAPIIIPFKLMKYWHVSMPISDNNGVVIYYSWGNVSTTSLSVTHCKYIKGTSTISCSLNFSVYYR